MKVLTMIICLFFTYTKLKAQQEPMYSQYMFNMLQINPAYAGNRAANNVTALFRKQWVGIDGAPSTATISFDSRLEDSNVGYGIQLYNDRIGVESTSGLQAFYSYRLSFKNSFLSMGLSAGVLNYRVGLSSVETVISDPAFSDNVNIVLPTVGFGVLYASDTWYAGFSIPALLNTKINSPAYQITTSANDHFFLTGGYIFDVSESVKLKPSILLKAVKGAPFEFDFNINAWILKTVGLGVSYRTGDALIGMFEFQITPELGLGYAYDYTITQLRDFNTGTHELMLRYEFGNKKTNRTLSPRYY
jgi:type IX secretion system PorP/SprF family membrane protein